MEALAVCEVADGGGVEGAGEGELLSGDGSRSVVTMDTESLRAGDVEARALPRLTTKALTSTSAVWNEM